VKTIQNSKMVLLFLDILEEFRNLSLQEWNFKSLVQQHIEHLLEQQRLYRKQRGNIKWATLDDENTKLFHVNATIKHIRNAIRTLKNARGQEVFSHEEKASLLWVAYKGRLGTNEFSKIHFDLNALLQPVGNLDDLIASFNSEEINNVIKDLKNGKSPGPDGFNTNFMKKC
jgi:hypothetical protein